MTAPIQKTIRYFIPLKPIPIKTIRVGRKFIDASISKVFFESLLSKDNTIIAMIHEFKNSHNGTIENSKLRRLATMKTTNSNKNISKAIRDIFLFIINDQK